MNKVTISILSLVIMCSGLEACVEYNPSTGSYTVDQNGSVDHENKPKQSDKKSDAKPAKEKSKAK